MRRNDTPERRPGKRTHRTATPETMGMNTGAPEIVGGFGAASRVRNTTNERGTE